MSNLKIYNVIGIMSGTSMDGVDFSFIQTDGINYIKIIYEKNYEYSTNYKNKLRILINDLPKNKKDQLKYTKYNEEFITNNFIKYIKNFIKTSKRKTKSKAINLIGLSGQTIFHHPKKHYSIQLANGKIIYKKIKIPIVVNFRQKDLLHGGQGAPIGSFYHKSILDKINKKACIINLGGISNLTFANNKKLISYDLGPANALIDDLCRYFYNKNFDNDGHYAKNGKLIKTIYSHFKKDIFLKQKYPKSLDRNHFYFYYKELCKFNANDAIHTASMMSVYCITDGIKLIKEKIEIIILTGGGRKNLFIKKNLNKVLKHRNINVKNIEIFKYNGDMIEAQMFGYLAVRSLKKLPLSLPSTTGVIKAVSGGIKYGKLIKD